MIQTALFDPRRWPAWTAGALALLGMLVYVIQSLLYAHTTITSLDEGGYLYKGFLFAEGIYRPFQPYGVWTNKMPLSFLIPGYVQEIFGAGLRTGRYLAVFEGVLTVSLLWLVARRMSGKWLAAGAVWVLALSPAVIKYYSVAASQSLTACLLVLSLALAIGEDRKAWQLMLSASLASLMILTRQNMLVVLPLLLGYTLWQHGWKRAALAATAGLGVLVIGHWVFWPGILEIWAPWAPRGFASLLSDFRPSGGSGAWDPSVTLFGRIVSAFQGLRVHFVALGGGILSLIFWPKRKNWKNESSYRAALFLALLYFLLLWMHSWASLDKDYCVYCFTPYVAFFSVAGILLVVISLPSWNTSIPPVLMVGLSVLILVLCAGIGFSLFEEIGNWLIALPAPRVRGGRLLGGFTSIFEFLFNKYGLEANPAKRYTSAAAGLLTGVLILFSVLAANRTRIWQAGRNMAYSFLMLGLIFSPLLAGHQGAIDCRQDVIKANELAGADLDQYIQPGSQAYWDGGLSVVPMLYAPQVRIYPPQINDGYSYRTGGDSDVLLRFGLWNSELDQRWRAEADYIIIEEWRYLGWKPFLSPARFEELPRSSSSTSCIENTHLRIFKRIR